MVSSFSKSQTGHRNESCVFNCSGSRVAWTLPNSSTSISVCSILSKALFKKVLYKYCFAHAVLNSLLAVMVHVLVGVCLP